MDALRVLIVEDEYLVMISIQSIVEELGHTIVGLAQNGTRAIELAEELLPDLILMDINMPKVDGIRAALQIKEATNTPVIIISGYSAPELINNASDAGVLAYLLKPVTIRELAPAITIAVNRHKEMEQLRNEAEDAKNKLIERKEIEKAKAILIKYKQMSDDEAMKFMQRMAQNKGVTLVRLARAINKKQIKAIDK